MRPIKHYYYQMNCLKLPANLTNSYAALRIISVALLCLLLSTTIKSQSSLYMPGGTNWVSVGDLDVAGDKLTVEALIYYTGASVNIVSKHTNPGDVNYLLRIGSFEITTTSGFAAFGGVAATGVSLVPNKMYHVAATYDGAMLKYYVNGCLTGQMAWTGMMVQNNLITAIGNMSTCQCEQFTGYIDEVRIWNVARTQTEIATNMLNLPTPAIQPGLQGYWKFDGNYINQQGNPAFDGVAVGAPAYQQIPLPYPTALFESVTSSNPVCAGDANGVINVSASGYYTPYEYSLDGITYGSSPVFPGLNAGAYIVYTRPQNNNNCVVSSPVIITDPPVLNPNLTTTNVSCNGGADGTANIAPSGGDGPNYHQLWQPSLNTTTGITGLPTGNYSVAIMDTCKASGQELITNGHFEEGNTGFTNGYTCCAGGPGFYAVDADPSYYNAGHAGSGYGGGGNYLIVDGSTAAGTSAWCQTIPVMPNTYYSFSAFIASNYNSVLAVVDFTINGVTLGTLNAPATTFTWDPFAAVWFSGASTSANICIYDLNTTGGGNDFGIDNISFKTCLSCTATAPFTITNSPLLTANASASNLSICPGNTTNLTSAVAGGTGSYSYSWSNGSLFSSQTVGPVLTTNYTITVTDSMGCIASDSVLITLFVPAVINLGNDTAICQGDMITLNAGGGFASYLWQNASTAQTLNASVADQYFVSAVDPNGCIVTDTLILTINPLPVIGLSDTLRICPGTSATLIANPGYASYLWSTGAVTSSITASIAGNNVVIVQDANGCINSDSTLVMIDPIPDLVFTVSPLAGCSPLSVTTQNNSLLNGAVIQTWLWQIGPNSSNNFAPETVLPNAGLYNVFLQATTTNGCIVDTLLTNYIEVYPSPAAVISPESQEYELFDDNINIADLSTGATIYDWSLFNISISNQADLVYPITVPGSFAFQLLVMNQYGCMDSTDVTIVVNPGFAIYFPNAFTPDGSGTNDLYMPKGYGIKEFEIMIFDRWGEMVFKSTDMNIGWNGTVKGSSPFQDVYVYKCCIRDLKDNKHFYTGHITLVQ